MAQSLEYPVVFKALIDGGHICETHLSDGRAWRYTMHCPTRQTYCLGHITPKQFRQLQSNRIIHEVRPEPSVDKGGNVYFYYRLWSADDEVFPRVTDAVQE